MWSDELRTKFERYSVADAQGNRILSEQQSGEILRLTGLGRGRSGANVHPHAARAAADAPVAGTPSCTFVAVSLTPRYVPRQPPFLHSADFAGFKYLVRSCPGVDKPDDEIEKLFVAAAQCETARRG